MKINNEFCFMEVFATVGGEKIVNGDLYYVHGSMIPAEGDTIIISAGYGLREKTFQVESVRMKLIEGRADYIVECF